MQVQTHTEAYNAVLSAIRDCEQEFNQGFHNLVQDKNELGCAMTGAGLTLLSKLRQKVEHLRRTTEVLPGNEAEATIAVNYKQLQTLLDKFKGEEGEYLQVIAGLFPAK